MEVDVFGGGVLGENWIETLNMTFQKKIKYYLNSILLL